MFISQNCQPKIIFVNWRKKGGEYKNQKREKKGGGGWGLIEAEELMKWIRWPQSHEKLVYKTPDF